MDHSSRVSPRYRGNKRIGDAPSSRKWKQEPRDRHRRPGTQLWPRNNIGLARRRSVQVACLVTQLYPSSFLLYQNYDLPRRITNTRILSFDCIWKFLLTKLSHRDLDWVFLGVRRLGSTICIIWRASRRFRQYFLAGTRTDLPQIVATNRVRDM